MKNLLDNISNPSDLRKLNPEQLPQLAKELRAFIIDIVATKEGHLGASLGVVELTIALHYVFQDFNLPIGSEISGKIVVDNSNSIINNCQIPFSVTINELTATNDAHLENSVDIFPNPEVAKPLINSGDNETIFK